MNLWQVPPDQRGGEVASVRPARCVLLVFPCHLLYMGWNCVFFNKYGGKWVPNLGNLWIWWFADLFFLMFIYIYIYINFATWWTRTGESLVTERHMCTFWTPRFKKFQEFMGPNLSHRWLVSHGTWDENPSKFIPFDCQWSTFWSSMVNGQPTCLLLKPHMFVT